jgi:molybdenum cofactor biosynthesis protein B
VGVEDHRSALAGVRCAVLTISDTRALETDVSGRAIVELLEEARHVVAKRQILRDNPKDVHDAVLGQIGGVEAVITTGGTGITSRDSTYEAISGLLHKRLDGFGELFRMLSFEQIGAAAMMSRACAGLSAGRILVCMPGSEAAVRLAMEKLVIPELGHLVQQARK